MSKTKMQKWTLYFHGACFDGLVSGAVAWAFLSSENCNFERFVPVRYDVRRTWLSEPLRTPAAVVDFLYHPDADFWVDHHATAFLTDVAKQDFLRRRTTTHLLYDAKAGSSAKLLWGALASHMPSAERYREAVLWAEKTDTANYASVDEAIWGDSPALRINQSLSLENEFSYYHFLLTELRSGELDRVAKLPPVAERFVEVRRRINAGFERVRQGVRLLGTVAVMDVESENNDIVNRYFPYKVFPQARYSIGILRSLGGVAITAMRNPWMEFHNIPLGKLMETFGGGGHERVGSVLIPSDKLDQVNKIVDRILFEMRQRSPVGSVSA